MLFVTNRAITQTENQFSLSVSDNTVGQSVTFSRRIDDGVYEDIGSKAFFSELKQSPYKQLLLYIHGFNTLPDAAFSHTERLQSVFDELGGKEFVQVIPLIWPCDSDFGIIKDYWDDQKSADASAFAFARMLQKFVEWRHVESTLDNPCVKRINMLAHSMGNRVLRQTLNAWSKYDSADQGVPLIFRNTFLVASDIVNESLEPGKGGQFIPQASRNTMVFYASDDLALRGSKVSNVKNRVASRRLGHSGPEDMDKTPPNVYAYDCDDFNNSYDSPTGHTYFFRKGEKISPVAMLMMAAMKTGRAVTTLPQHSKRRFIVPLSEFENTDFVGRLHKP